MGLYVFSLPIPLKMIGRIRVLYLIVSMSHLPLFRVRSWESGMRCRFFSMFIEYWGNVRTCTRHHKRDVSAELHLNNGTFLHPSVLTLDICVLRDKVLHDTEYISSIQKIHRDQSLESRETNPTSDWHSVSYGVPLPVSRKMWLGYALSSSGTHLCSCHMLAN